MLKSSESSGISHIYNNIHFWRENRLEKKQTQQKTRNPTWSYWNTGFREGWWGRSGQSLAVLAPHSRWLRCGTEPREGGVGGGCGRGAWEGAERWALFLSRREEVVLKQEWCSPPGRPERGHVKTISWQQQRRNPWGPRLGKLFRLIPNSYSGPENPLFKNKRQRIMIESHKNILPKRRENK